MAKKKKSLVTATDHIDEAHRLLTEDLKFIRTYDTNQTITERQVERIRLSQNLLREAGIALSAHYNPDIDDTADIPF